MYPALIESVWLGAPVGSEWKDTDARSALFGNEGRSRRWGAAFG